MAPQQTINGQTYTMYSPAWYAARDAGTIHDAGVAGTAAGTAQGSATKADFSTLYPGQGLPQEGPNPSYGNGTSGGNVSRLSGGGGGSGGGGSYNGMNRPLNPALSGLIDSLSHPTGAPGSVATPDQIAPIAHVDTSGAQSAEFAHAKDQVGQESAGALTGLRAALAGRGMLGSGAEARATANVVMRGQGELGDVSRSQATTAAGIDATEAAANHQSDVVQRGQDIQAQTEANNLQLQYAQLGAQQRMAALAGLNAALKG